MMRAVFLRIGLGLALYLANAQSAFALDVQQAVTNIQYIEVARLDGQACERSKPGATQEFKEWFATVQYVQKKSIKVIEESARKKGVSEEGIASVVAQSIAVLNRQVADEYRFSARRCAAIKKTFNFYKSQLQE